MHAVSLAGLTPPYKDMVTGDAIDLETDITLAPFQFLWLVPEG